jgi:hypothetical protein
METSIICMYYVCGLNQKCNSFENEEKEMSRTSVLGSFVQQRLPYVK